MPKHKIPIGLNTFAVALGHLAENVIFECELSVEKSAITMKVSEKQRHEMQYPGYSRRKEREFSQ